MKTLTRLMATVMLVSLSMPKGALSAPTACPEQFYEGEAPDEIPSDEKGKTQELCYLQFAVLHSSGYRTPIWSAEHLTRERVEAAGEQHRINAFHAEYKLPPNDRADLVDYKQSGFDRGHMAPSGDMPDSDSQRESFTLANMIPQDANNNRGLWARIEASVRDMASNDQDIYVVTGPIYREPDIQRINGRVAVPSQIFKAIYDPAKHAGGAYLVDNAPGSDWQVISLLELQRLSGIDVFPKLEMSLKDHAMALPWPAKMARYQNNRGALLGPGLHDE